MFRSFISCCIMFLSVSVSYGQGPWDRARTTIAGKNVEIEYGRPVLRGRSLAELMNQLPPDRVWRAGAGPVTILSTDTDLVIGGKKVPAGNYSLYMYCPENGEYALIINRDIGEPSGSVLEKPASDRSNRAYPHFMDYTMAIVDKEVARIPLKQIKSPKTEILIYAFEPSGAGATLKISWGDQSWTTEFQPAS